MKNVCGIIFAIAVLIGEVISLRGVGSAETIYTPNLTPVTVTIQGDSRSLDEILSWNNTYRKQYPNAQFIGDLSNSMNYHGYAWHLSEGGVPVFLTDIAAYWTDGSYLPYTSLPGDTSKADKAVYNGTAHSVITTPQNPWLISKLGARALMRHTNYDNYTAALFTYYRAARQPRANPFAVTYGGDGADAAASMSFTVDGGVIVAGSTTSFGASGSDGWLLKLDREGKIPAADPLLHLANGWQKRDGGGETSAVQPAHVFT